MLAWDDTLAHVTVVPMSTSHVPWASPENDRSPVIDVETFVF